MGTREDERIERQEWDLASTSALKDSRKIIVDDSISVFLKLNGSTSLYFNYYSTHYTKKQLQSIIVK